MRKGWRCWGKCTRCDKRANIERREINSAKGARCPDCGGRMELSTAQQDRVALAKDYQDTHRREQ